MIDDDSTQRKDVGYGRPPVEHQFRKGQSGNPLGRPRKSRRPRKVEPTQGQEIHEMFLRQARKPLKVRDGDSTIEMTAIEAVARSMFGTALKGNTRAQSQVMAMFEASKQQEAEALQARKDEFERQQQRHRNLLAYADREGIELPFIGQHPDDCYWSEEKNAPVCRGPVTGAQECSEAILVMSKDAVRGRLARLKIAERHSAAGHPEHADEIREGEQLLRVMENHFPDPKVRRAPGFDMWRWSSAPRDQFLDIKGMTHYSEAWKRRVSRGHDPIETVGPEDGWSKPHCIGPEGHELDFAHHWLLWFHVLRTHDCWWGHVD